MSQCIGVQSRLLLLMKLRLCRESVAFMLSEVSDNVIFNIAVLGSVTHAKSFGTDVSLGAGQQTVDLIIPPRGLHRQAASARAA